MFIGCSADAVRQTDEFPCVSGVAQRFTRLRSNGIHIAETSQNCVLVAIMSATDVR
jgi:hypothetical protein